MSKQTKNKCKVVFGLHVCHFGIFCPLLIYLGLVNKLSSIFGWLRLRLAVSAKPCSPAGKSDYQPVGLHFASLPALSSLSQK